jgi:hypothetical protein
VNNIDNYHVWILQVVSRNWSSMMIFHSQYFLVKELRRSIEINFYSQQF